MYIHTDVHTYRYMQAYIHTYIDRQTDKPIIRGLITQRNISTSRL